MISGCLKKRKKRIIMSNLYDRQDRIKGLNSNMSLTIVGCGGIGFWVAKFAAMSGISKIYLFDPDIIEEHNLARLDLPLKLIGRNKAEITKLIIQQLRPECNVYALPFKFQEHTFGDTDWIIDCTDKHDAQLNNQKIAQKFGKKYMKAGYDGENLSIHNSVAEWGEVEDGYQVIPSWVVPAVIVAALTIAKVMKYTSNEIVTSINNILCISKQYDKKQGF